jgi:hypothetical protein
MSKVDFTQGLNMVQKAHYKAFQWLISFQCGSGRSHLLARVFVEKALENINCLVGVFEHKYNTAPAMAYMYKEIEGVFLFLNLDREYALHTLPGHRAIRIVKKKEDKNG